MSSRYLIYALSDPRTGEIRYVGKSSSGLRRPYHHLSPCRLKYEKTWKSNWIKSLRDIGMKPVVEVIEEINSEELLNDAERFWIVQWKALGMRLTNLTDGGDGAAGRRMTVEHRAKIAAATMGNTRMLGKKLSPEARMKISASHKGEGNPAAKLSNEDVIEIRRLHSSGMPTRTICARFGIGQPYVSRLTNPNSTKPARVL